MICVTHKIELNFVSSLGLHRLIKWRNQSKDTHLPSFLVVLFSPLWPVVCLLS
jgi:hypothetical protein